VVHCTFDAQSSPPDRDGNSFNICWTQSSFEYMKNAYSDSGPIISPLRKPTYLREKGKGHTYHESIVLSERFQSSNSPSCIVYEKLDTNIIALSPVVQILVLPKHDDLLPQHAKSLLGICIQCALNAMHVRKTTSARLPSSYTDICVTSQKR
jgi:hypothetical protein